ncbi:UNC93-like protein MFSD11 [Belonocnema kinseyi]|uniref:UNC93-like protein MFSD11 n=1 Tax=Belonocnema kinseyi TaxID=2817044 RepID=UPI00143DCBEE|nr:UNC93-like protein MFSD11 [Belonocnema kinseyi]
MIIDREFLNVLILSWGFMFTFSAFLTTSNIQKTVLDSIANEDSNFTGDGYSSLAIVYAVLSICTIFTPCYAQTISPRLSIFTGSLCYAFFVATFLWPQTILLYFASAVQGLGASLMWVGHGRYLTKNSNSDTISRNSGIFWAIYQLSLVTGNVSVYCIFTSKNYDKPTRRLIFIILTILAVIGTLILATLRKPQIGPFISEGVCEKEKEKEPKKRSYYALLVAWKRMRKALKLIVTPNLIMLTLTFIYSGLVLAFYSGVYTSSFGFTAKMGESRKKLVSLVGICLGIGEVTAGIIFGPLASIFKIRSRWIVLVIGSITHAFCYLTILINLPNNSPFTDTDDIGFISPSVALAMVGAIALGFGDACLNTQIISLLGTLYSNDAESVFSLYLFVQSIAVTLSFFYSNYFGLHLQLGILIVVGLLGTISFVIVDFKSKANDSIIPVGVENKTVENPVELETVKRY